MWRDAQNIEYFYEFCLLLYRKEENRNIYKTGSEMSPHLLYVFADTFFHLLVE